MKTKLILAICLALLAGLCLAVALVRPPASLADGPPPTGTLQRVKVSYPFHLDLATVTGQSVNRPVRPIHMRLDPPGLPRLALRPAALTANGTGWQKIIAEDFEGAFPPPGWVLTDTSSTDGGEYFWGQRDCKVLSGSYILWAGGGGSDGRLIACGQTYADNLYTWLIYGPVDLSLPVTDAELQFVLWSDTEALIIGDIFIPIDPVWWGISTNGIDFTGYHTGGSTGDWTPASLDLADDPWLGNFTGQPAVYFGWLFESNATNPIPYEGAFIDEVALWTYTPPPPPPAPPTPTLPITIHTTITDFMRGRSDEISVSSVSGGDYGDGALIPAAQMTAIGDWERLPSLPGKELRRFAAVAAKGHLFVTGGISLDVIQLQQKYQRQVYSALIRDDGSLGHWLEVSQLPQALSNHAAVVANDHLFVLGGLNANGVQKSVFSAPLNEDGTLGPWTTLPDLLEPLFVHAAVSTHGYIYVLGGRKAIEESLVSDVIYRAAVSATGSLGPWETLPVKLPGPRQFHAVVAACDHLYLIGGADAELEWQHVYQAEVHPDGSLGAWSQTIPLAKTLSAPAATAVRGGILITGGWSSGDPVFQSQKSVYWAPFDPTCALGSWVDLTPLPYPMSHHALVATDRYVYNLGGTNAAPRFFDSVLMAPLQGGNDLVQHGTFNHQFHLGSKDNYVIEALRWTAEGGGEATISLRYRVGAADSGVYGPWSAYTSTNSIPVNALGGYLEYELKFEGGSGLNDRRVSEVNLTISAPPSVHLPLVIK